MAENTHSLTEIICRLVEPLASSLNVTLWGVEVIPGGRSIIRIFVESQDEAGVDVEQCASVSRLLALALDVEDCMPGAYTLEVSSPGLERRFFTAGQLAGAVGTRIEVSLIAAPDDFPYRRKFVGLLTAAPAEEGGLFSLAAEDIVPPSEEPPLLQFSFSEIRKAKQVYTAPEKSLPGKKKKVTKVSPANDTGLADEQTLPRESDGSKPEGQ